MSVGRGTEPVTGTPFASTATLKARDLAIPRRDTAFTSQQHSRDAATELARLLLPDPTSHGTTLVIPVRK